MDTSIAGIIIIAFFVVAFVWIAFFVSRGGQDYAVRDIKESLQKRQEARRAKLERRYYSDKFYAWWNERERELGYEIPEFAARAQWIQQHGGDWKA